jgi:hypothetical protein
VDPVIFTRSQLGILLKLLLYEFVESPISAQLKKAPSRTIFCIRESLNFPIFIIEHVRLSPGVGVGVCSFTRLIVHDISLSLKLLVGAVLRSMQGEVNRMSVAGVIYVNRQIKSMPGERIVLVPLATAWVRQVFNPG